MSRRSGKSPASTVRRLGDSPRGRLPAGGLLLSGAHWLFSVHQTLYSGSRITWWCLCSQLSGPEEVLGEPLSARASLVAQTVKNLPIIQVRPLDQMTPWRRAGQPTPVFLPGEAHGQRSLVGYSLWGCKESGVTE